MLDNQCITPAISQLKRSLEQHCKMESPSLVEAQKRKKINRFSSTNQQPRWHNQAYMLFLALRQHSEKTMARTDLIKSALAIDKRISDEHLVPKVFRGKTPMNSASAILTNNSDRYFIPFKPDGSKSMHFRLSFEPGSFESAFKEYNEWQEKLVKNDWPYCFGTKKEVMVENIVKELEIHNTYPTEFDEFIANRKKARLQLQQQDQKQEKEKENTNYMSNYSSEQLQHIPQTWQEIISLRKSSIGGVGGVFANRKLPKDTPLGFYFGVPMTEDEFDSMKDGIGQASDYTYMYRKTVIDPTDQFGNLYFQNGNSLCPFHYIKETSIREKVNVAFYEGDNINQIICWSKRDISPGEELFVYCNSKYNSISNTNNIIHPISTISPVTPSTSSSNSDYWQKKPSISSMLNTTIPIV